MIPVGLEPMISVLEWTKTIHTLGPRGHCDRRLVSLLSHNKEGKCLTSKDNYM
jgi:hypothetical protein